MTTTLRKQGTSSEASRVRGRPLSWAAAGIPMVTSVLAVVALEMVAADTEVPPPAWVETWSTIALLGLMGGLLLLTQRSRWGWAGVGAFGVVLLAMAAVCFVDGHRNAALATQAISGAAVLVSLRASARLG